MGWVTWLLLDECNWDMTFEKADFRFGGRCEVGRGKVATVSWKSLRSSSPLSSLELYVRWDECSIFLRFGVDSDIGSLSMLAVSREYWDEKEGQRFTRRTPLSRRECRISVGLGMNQMILCKKKQHQSHRRLVIASFYRLSKRV